jgi:hypothetical protein
MSGSHTINSAAITIHVIAESGARTAFAMASPMDGGYALTG